MKANKNLVPIAFVAAVAWLPGASASAAILFGESVDIVETNNFWYRKLESPFAIAGFNEEQNVTLDRDIFTQPINSWDDDVSADGTTFIVDEDWGTIAAGTTVSSHVVYLYNRPPISGTNKLERRAIVKFDSPILGFMGDLYWLGKTNDLFAPEPTPFSYMEQIGLDRPNRISLENRDDIVKILDPTTIEVDFGNYNGVDPLRVITEAVAPVPEPLTIVGSGTVLGVGAILKRKYAKKAKI